MYGRIIYYVCNIVDRFFLYLNDFVNLFYYVMVLEFIKGYERLKVEMEFFLEFFSD